VTTADRRGRARSGLSFGVAGPDTAEGLVTLASDDATLLVHSVSKRRYVQAMDDAAARLRSTLTQRYLGASRVRA
jgi:hypothetical protein